VSAIAVGGALLLPYSIDQSPLSQRVAVQQVAPEPRRPPAEPARPAAPSAQQQAQNAPVAPPATSGQQQAPDTAQPVAIPGGDAEHGRLVYRKCQACHSLEPGKNGVGPTLSRIIGKQAASDPGFAYSPALRSSGLTWDLATLDRYLLDPQK